MPTKGAGCTTGCSRWFVRKKYKNFIAEVYPKNQDEGIIQPKGKKLAEYAVNNTYKLPRIGKYLQDRVQRDLNRRRFGFVKVSMKAMNFVIGACHSDTEMSLLSENVIAIIAMLIKHPREDLRMAATETFIEFICWMDESPNSKIGNLDRFVEDFCEYALDTSADLVAQRRIRMAGLLALDHIIRKILFQLSEEKPKRIIDAILVNMLYPMDKDVNVSTLVDRNNLPRLDAVRHLDSIINAKQESVRSLAYLCLMDIGCRANIASVKNLLDPMFAHLDKNNQWTPVGKGFGSEVFAVVCISRRDHPGYVEVVFVQLLRHLDVLPSASSEVKAAVVSVARDALGYLRGSIGPALIGRQSLVRELSASIQRGAKGDTDEALLQKSIVECLGRFGSKMGSWAEFTDMLVSIMLQMPPLDKDGTSSGEYSVERKVLLETTAKLIEEHRAARSTLLSFAEDQHMFPTALLEPLINSIRLHDKGVSNPEIRLLALNVIHAILKPAAESGSDLISESIGMSMSFSYDSRSPLSLTRTQRGWLHSALYSSVLLEDNSPDHFVAIYNLFGLLLSILKNKELLTAVPLMFRLQEESAQDSLQADTAKSIGTLILAFFLWLSEDFKLPSLGKHVRKIMEIRQGADLLSNTVQATDTGLIKASSTLSSSSSSQAVPQRYTSPGSDPVSLESTKIDRALVVEELLKVPGLQTQRTNARAALESIYEPVDIVMVVTVPDDDPREDSITQLPEVVIDLTNGRGLTGSESSASLDHLLSASKPSKGQPVTVPPSTSLRSPPLTMPYVKPVQQTAKTYEQAVEVVTQRTLEHQSDYESIMQVVGEVIKAAAPDDTFIMSPISQPLSSSSFELRLPTIASLD